MKKIFSLFAVFSAIFAALSIFPLSAESEFPLPPENVHPRVLFTQEKLSEIQANLKSPENAGALKEKNRLLNVFFQNPLSYSKEMNFKTEGQFVAVVEAAAFEYALTKDEKYARFAYGSLVNLLKTFNPEKVYDKYRPAGQLVFAAAEVYDWCYGALSSKEKKLIVSKSLSVIQNYFQIGWPPAKQNAVNGHGCESQLLKALLAFGIAVYDENPSIWKTVVKRFYSEYVPVRNYVYESGLPTFQGIEYGMYRPIFDLWSHFLITGMGLESPYGEKIKNWSHSYLYYGFLFANSSFHFGDAKLNSLFNEQRTAALMLMASSAAADSYAKFKAREITNNFTKFAYNTSGESDDKLSPVQFLIFNDVNLKCLPPDSLPLVNYVKSPYGEYVLRSSWSDKNAPLVRMKIGELYSSNHEHRDAGDFAFSQGEILSEQAGVYISGSSFKSGYNKEFYHGTGAQNCLLVEGDGDFGGQKEYEDGISDIENFLNGDKYLRAKVLNHSDSVKNIEETGKGYAYISGDLTRAYPNAEKVKRHMLSILTGDEENRLIFVVYDKISAKSGCNGVFQFQAKKKTEIKSDKKGFSMRGGNVFLNENVLLPLNPEIKIFSGEENSTVGGKNYKKTLSKDALEKSSKQFALENSDRIEIRSEKREKNETFFNVFSTWDNTISENQIEDAKLIQTDDFDCALIKNYAVCFVKNGDGGFSFPANLPAETTVFVINSESGEISVKNESSEK